MVESILDAHCLNSVPLHGKLSVTEKRHTNLFLFLLIETVASFWKL